MKRLLDLRPCDNCNGPIGLQFYVVRFSLALVKPQAVNEFLGMHQFFGGRAHPAVVENFAPTSTDAVVVAMDAEPTLANELVICSGCYLDKPLDLPLLSERINQRRKDADSDDTTEVTG